MGWDGTEAIIPQHCKVGWIDGWLVGWMVGWLDRWMDGVLVKVGNGGHRIHYCNVKWVWIAKEKRRIKPRVQRRSSDWPNVAEGEEEDEVVVRTCVESSFVSTVEDAEEEEEGD